MRFKRSSGILLHPTSLPSPDGIGDLGPDAYEWVRNLSKMGCGLWQILPLGPTGFGDSPYQCFSAFAGNPYLISPILLVEYGLLSLRDLSSRPNFLPDKIKYGDVIQWKTKLLNIAYDNLLDESNKNLFQELDAFSSQEEYWLKDYSIFMAIKESQGGKAWSEWPSALNGKKKKAIIEFSKNYSDQIYKYIFRQFLFHKQWQALHTYARENGVQIIGDIPIFIAFDSADAWANSELFQFDKNLQPAFVAGVPPDYFAPTGQLWGNPLYQWDYHKKTGYAWWIQRIKATLNQVDIIRLDHFRGFVDYWEIPANMPTAETGIWKPGPGKPFFDAIKNQIGELPIIAEDLGQINPAVFQLRDDLDIPGMKILQFGFSNNAADPFLPHNYPKNCIAYIGTHDNDTCLGWFENASEKEKDYCRKYLASSGENITWDLTRLLWSSVARVTITTMQDILNKGSEARMNYPGHPAGNWTWRFKSDDLTDEIIRAMRELNTIYGRLSGREL